MDPNHYGSVGVVVQVGETLADESERSCCARNDGTQFWTILGQAGKPHVGALLVWRCWLVLWQTFCEDVVCDPCGPTGASQTGDGVQNPGWSCQQ